MFHRITTVLAVLLFAMMAAASAIGHVARTETGQCNTGPVQCCNSVQSANAPGIASLLGLLGVVVGSITGQVGVTCSPISVIGLPGNSCSAQPVCCTNNNFNGIIALGCTPININL